VRGLKIEPKGLWIDPKTYGHVPLTVTSVETAFARLTWNERQTLAAAIRETIDRVAPTAFIDRDPLAE
jgi:hypothetical protein